MQTKYLCVLCIRVRLSNCLFPIETHITCDFPGGSGSPVPPPPGDLRAIFKGAIAHKLSGINPIPALLCVPYLLSS